jgi:hypothetical protein
VVGSLGWAGPRAHERPKLSSVGWAGGWTLTSGIGARFGPCLPWGASQGGGMPWGASQGGGMSGAGSQRPGFSPTSASQGGRGQLIRESPPPPISLAFGI